MLKSELFTKKVDKKPLYDYYTTRQCKNQVRFEFSHKEFEKILGQKIVYIKQKKNPHIESSVKIWFYFTFGKGFWWV